jgi:hypothetical protein
MLSLALGATASTFRRYGCGVAQEIDAAAMTYLKYQRYDTDVTGLSRLSAVSTMPITSAPAH